MTAAGRGRGPAAPKAGDPGFEAKVAADAEAAAVSAAIGPLAGYTREVPLRVQMAVGWKPGDAASAALWVVGELGGVADAGPQWNEGFDATATLTTPADVTVATGRLTAPRGARTFRIALTPSQPLAAGEYVLRVGARAGPSTIPSREVLRFAIPEAPGSAGALFVRRGPTTGNKEVPTADLRFRRSESVRVEIPTSADAAGTARLLDRTGKPLAVPVAAAIRDDAGWIALADGAARAGAAGARGLRHRDREWRTADAVGVPHRPVTTSTAETAEQQYSLRELCEFCGYRRYDPPSENVSVHGLSGWPSVPRIPSSSSTFSVRKRSSGFVNFSSSTRLARVVLKRELRRRRRRLAAFDALRLEILRPDVSLQRRLDRDRARTGSARVVVSETSVSSWVGALNTTSAAARPARGSARPRSRVSVGGLRERQAAGFGVEPQQPARLLNRALDLSQRLGVDPRVEGELEILAVRVLDLRPHVRDPDRRVGRAQHEVVAALAPARPAGRRAGCGPETGR